MKFLKNLIQKYKKNVKGSDKFGNVYSVSYDQGRERRLVENESGEFPDMKNLPVEWYFNLSLNFSLKGILVE
jgi:NADH:ubiquinone oxidoreductase subunit